MLGFSTTDLNGDDIVEEGEQATLSIDYTNNGDGDAQDITATITSTSSDLSVLTPSVNLGDLAVGNTDLFDVDIAVASTCSGTPTIPLDVVFSGTNFTDAVFEVVPEIDCTRPDITFVSFSTSELTGNGDGLYSEGETLIASVFLQNSGDTATNIAATTITSSEPFDLTVTSATLSPLHPSWTVAI